MESKENVERGKSEILGKKKESRFFKFCFVKRSWKIGEEIKYEDKL